MILRATESARGEPARSIMVARRSSIWAQSRWVAWAADVTASLKAPIQSSTRPSRKSVRPPMYRRAFVARATLMGGAKKEETPRRRGTAGMRERPARAVPSPDGWIVSDWGGGAGARGAGGG